MPSLGTTPPPPQEPLEPALYATGYLHEFSNTPTRCGLVVTPHELILAIGFVVPELWAWLVTLVFCSLGLPVLCILLLIEKPRAEQAMAAFRGRDLAALRRLSAPCWFTNPFWNVRIFLKPTIQSVEVDAERNEVHITAERPDEAPGLSDRPITMRVSGMPADLPALFQLADDLRAACTAVNLDKGND